MLEECRDIYGLNDRRIQIATSGFFHPFRPSAAGLPIVTLWLKHISASGSLQ